MASVTPRASGFWEEGMAVNYFEDGDDVEQQNLINEVLDDGRTPVRYLAVTLRRCIDNDPA